MSGMTRDQSREYFGLLQDLGIVKDKRLLIRHFTEDRETVEKICGELRKLDKQPTPYEAEQLILGVIMREHFDRVEVIKGEETEE
ncbi:MAG: hypothetical protein IJJ61_09900 [Clostridia bacterium]|nr:hypothetical protein [Clostridia bacterium]